MKKLALNDSVNPDFEPFWFNTQIYTDKQAGKEGFTLIHEDRSKQLFIRLYKKEDQLVSPWRAPFGGIEFSKETDIQTLYDFIKEMLERVKVEGINQISIVAPPECYSLEKSDLMDEALIHAGFSVTVTELNYHLNSEDGDFESQIDPPEKRKIAKCIEAGFECYEETTPDYAQIHRFIKDCRNRKGHPLSMNAVDFEKMFFDFPERYKLFVVKDKATLIASAIGVKVSSDILYNFLGADHEDYLPYSPTVLLNKVMYDYSCANGYKVYDLGIGTAAGVRNEGLIRFKEHIGGKLSHKYSYSIKFE